MIETYVKLVVVERPPDLCQATLYSIAVVSCMVAVAWICRSQVGVHCLVSLLISWCVACLVAE